MPLTDVSIGMAKAGPKEIKLSDGGGMILLVTPADGKLWRFKYRIDGREKLTSFGGFGAAGERSRITAGSGPLFTYPLWRKMCSLLPLRAKKLLKMVLQGFAETSYWRRMPA